MLRGNWRPSAGHGAYALDSHSAQKKKPGEAVARFYLRDATEEANELVACWQEWAAHNVDALEYDRPTPAAGLSDRAQEMWEAVQAIFDRAGSSWATWGREAATALSGSSNVQDDNISIELLRDIKQV